MSPEQCRGAGLVDARTDVYSLGVMLFQLLTGETPFQGEGLGDLIVQHLMEEPPSLASVLPGAPREIVGLVAEMLHKQATARPTMQGVTQRLMALGQRAEAKPAQLIAAPEPTMLSRLASTQIPPASTSSPELAPTQPLRRLEQLEPLALSVPSDGVQPESTKPLQSVADLQCLPTKPSPLIRQGDAAQARTTLLRPRSQPAAAPITSPPSLFPSELVTPRPQGRTRWVGLVASVIAVASIGGLVAYQLQPKLAPTSRSARTAHVSPPPLPSEPEVPKPVPEVAVPKPEAPALPKPRTKLVSKQHALPTPVTAPSPVEPSPPEAAPAQSHQYPSPDLRNPFWRSDEMLRWAEQALDEKQYLDSIRFAQTALSRKPSLLAVQVLGRAGCGRAKESGDRGALDTAYRHPNCDLVCQQTIDATCQAMGIKPPHSTQQQAESDRRPTN